MFRELFELDSDFEPTLYTVKNPMKTVIVSPCDKLKNSKQIDYVLLFSFILNHSITLIPAKLLHIDKLTFGFTTYSNGFLKIETQ